MPEHTPLTEQDLDRIRRLVFDNVDVVDDLVAEIRESRRLLRRALPHLKYQTQSDVERYLAACSGATYEE